MSEDIFLCFANFDMFGLCLCVLSCWGTFFFPTETNLRLENGHKCNLGRTVSLLLANSVQCLFFQHLISYLILPWFSFYQFAFIMLKYPSTAPAFVFLFNDLLMFFYISYATSICSGLNLLHYPAKQFFQLEAFF